jgi:predicted small integral membrane protein
MNRLERFRDMRRIRRKYAVSFFLCCLLLFSGICVADVSVNSLMKSENRIDIISFSSTGSFMEISLLNHKFYINISYVKRDYLKLKDMVNNLMHV